MGGMLFLLGAFGLMVAGGFAYFLRRSRIGTWAVLAGAGGLSWWAAHYLHALGSGVPLTADQEWHRTYLVWLLAVIPCALLIGGVIGFHLRQRAYMAQYRGIR